MTTGPPTDPLDELLSLVRGLTRAQIVALGQRQTLVEKEAKAAGRSKTGPTPEPELFWFAGGPKVPLTPGDKADMERLWSHLIPTLVMTVGPGDLQGSDRFGRMKRLRALVDRARLGLNQGEATTLFESSYGPAGMSGVIAIWNALCAALLVERLQPDQLASLEAVWRQAIGEPPRELLRVR